MTVEEKNQMTTILNGYTSLKIDEIIISHFQANDTDISSKLVLGNYTAQNLISVIKKLIANFKTEINSEGWPSLPSHVAHHDYGTRHLPTDLQSLLNQLNARAFDANTLVFIDYLIYYQRVNNFWHTNDVKIKIEKINEIEELIKSKSVVFQNSLNEYNALKANAEKLSISLQQLIDQKNQELAIINENAGKSTASLAGINEVLAESKAKRDVLLEVSANVNAISEEAKTRTEEERKRFEEYKKVIDEIQRILTEKIDNVTKTQEDWTAKLGFISEKETYIKDKQKEINDLTGFAAGVSLFHTFKERKKELQTPVDFWRWAVVVMAASVVVIVGLLFYFNPSTTVNGTSWGIFGLNTLKSLPAIILLYFAIRQYNKERTFQEEYAFKSSVALTINAFADKITTDGKTGKDALIMNSVAKVYETPNIMKERSSIFSFRAKPLNETMKNLTEAVKELKK